MREYELTVVYDLAVQEAGGPDASVQLLTTLVESRGAKLLKVDHWGRRRMAYPINRAIDGDYIVTRIDLDPSGVAPLEATLRIDERVYRHLVVRADELPLPLPPREPRQQPGFVAPVAAVAPVTEEPAAPEAPVAAATAELAPEAEATGQAAELESEAEAPVAAVTDEPATAAEAEATEQAAEPEPEPEAPVAAVTDEPAAEAEAATEPQPTPEVAAEADPAPAAEAESRPTA